MILRIARLFIPGGIAGGGGIIFGMVFLIFFAEGVDFGFDEGVGGSGRHAEVLAEAAEAVERGEDKAGANVGVLDPFNEFADDLLPGFFPGVFILFFVEFELAGVLLAAAEADGFAGQGGKELELLGDLGRELTVPVHEEAAELEADHGEEGVGLAGIGDLGVLEGVMGEVTVVAEGLLAELPGLEAALFPFGEVLRGDGAAGEVLLKGGLDFGQVVEPTDEADGGMAGIEAFVQLMADFRGEMGDFAIAGGIGDGGFGSDGLIGCRFFR